MKNEKNKNIPSKQANFNSLYFSPTIRGTKSKNQTKQTNWKIENCLLTRQGMSYPCREREEGTTLFNQVGLSDKFSIIVKDFESLLLSLDATRRNIQLSE